MIENLSIATHSHTDCADVWSMYFSQLKKHIPYLEHYFFANVSEYKPYSDLSHFIQYNDNDPYYKKYSGCISKVPTKYILNMNEDEILYENVDEKEIKRLVDFLEKSDYSFVRLIRSDVHDENYIGENILEISPRQHYFFSMQPTIWKREDLLKVIEDSEIKIIFEEKSVSNSLRKFNIKGSCVYKGEKEAGRNHYYSSTFPLVEVIARGKWIGSYLEILKPLWEEYNIDPSIRGINFKN